MWDEILCAGCVGVCVAVRDDVWGVWWSVVLSAARGIVWLDHFVLAKILKIKLMILFEEDLLKKKSAKLNKTKGLMYIYTAKWQLYLNINGILFNS